MANMTDYLDWRGDVPLSVSPFNEVDNLILSHVAYTDFGGIVSASGEAVPLSSVHEAFFQRHDREELIAEDTVMSRSSLLLDPLVTGPRFGGMKLCFYIDEFDADKAKQISAVTFLLDDGTAYVAFRGTDNSITGWKEDFNLSYLPETEGQKRALAYLDRVSASLSRPLRVGGHSKGANFAVYASALCREQDRIIAVYSNDGPGFHSEFIQSEAYQSILPRVLSILPDTAVIGLLLCSSAQRHVVKSSAFGIYQHDGFSWLVSRDRFVDAELSETAKFLDQTLDDWIDSMDLDSRRFFTETLFALIEATGKESFHDIRTSKLKSTEAILSSIRSLAKEDQAEMLRITGQLIQSGGHAALAQLPELIRGRDHRSENI